MPAPETFRRYETAYALRPDLTTDQINAVHNKLKETLAAHRGLVVKQEFWGKRTLAYPIERQRRGIYVLFEYVAPTGGLRGPFPTQELERVLKLNETVLRYLTVVLDERVNPADFAPVDDAPIFDGVLPPDEPEKPAKTRVTAKPADDGDDDDDDDDDDED